MPVHLQILEDAVDVAHAAYLGEQLERLNDERRKEEEKGQ